MSALVDLKDGVEALVRRTISECPEVQEMYDELRLKLADLESIIVFNDNTISETVNGLPYEQRVFLYLLEDYMHRHPRWTWIEDLRKKVLTGNKSLPQVGVTIKPSSRQAALAPVLRLENEEPRIK